MSGGEVAEAAIADRHQVAADRPVVRAERDAGRRGFERSPTSKDLLGVVAEEAQGRHVATGKEPVGDVLRPAEDTLACDRVHLRDLRRLERSLAAERFKRLVGRPVWDHDREFLGHGEIYPTERTSEEQRSGRTSTLSNPRPKRPILPIAAHTFKGKSPDCGRNAPIPGSGPRKNGGRPLPPPVTGQVIGSDQSFRPPGPRALSRLLSRLPSSPPFGSA